MNGVDNTLIKSAKTKLGDGEAWIKKGGGFHIFGSNVEYRIYRTSLTNIPDAMQLNYR